jgi:hypothetical protein
VACPANAADAGAPDAGGTRPLYGAVNLTDATFGPLDVHGANANFAYLSFPPPCGGLPIGSCCYATFASLPTRTYVSGGPIALSDTTASKAFGTLVFSTPSSTDTTGYPPMTSMNTPGPSWSVGTPSSQAQRVRRMSVPSLRR